MTRKLKRALAATFFMVGISISYTNCGGPKTASLFQGSTSSCPQGSCTTSVTGQTLSLRTLNDQALVDKTEGYVQLGGVCNPADSQVNQISYDIYYYDYTAGAWKWSEGNNGFTCENGRDFMTVKRPASNPTGGYHCDTNKYVAYNVTATLWYKVKSTDSSYLQGPQYTSTVNFKYDTSVCP